MGKALYILVCLPFISFYFLPGRNVKNEGEFQVDRNQSNVFTPIEDIKCTDCHELFDGMKSKHIPAQETCENCHQIDTAQHPDTSTTGLFLTEKVPELCFICHDALKNELDTTRLIHQAVKDKKQCMNCHSPHASIESKLIINREKEVCLSCHNKVINTSNGKISNIKEQFTKGRVIHPVIESDGCVVCHKPHSSSYNYLLTSIYPIGEYVPAKKENFEFCWQCHDSDLLEVLKTTTSTNFRDGDKNLHFVHSNGEKARNCNICHNVHATVKDHLIADKVPFGNWELPINYSATENGGSCFPGCHAKQDYAR